MLALKSMSGFRSGMSSVVNPGGRRPKPNPSVRFYMNHFVRLKLTARYGVSLCPIVFRLVQPIGPQRRIPVGVRRMDQRAVSRAFAVLPNGSTAITARNQPMKRIALSGPKGHSFLARSQVEEITIRS